MKKETKLVREMLLQLMREHKSKCKKSDCGISNILIIQNLKKHGYAIPTEKWKDLI